MPNTPRLKVGLDMDGCLADFIGAFRNESALVLGRQILGEPENWDFSNWMSQEEMDRVFHRIHNIRNWFQNFVQPLPYVAMFLRRYCQENEVYFISTRSEGLGDPVQVQTQNWLRSVYVEFPTVIITKHKGEVAAALRLDVFLDDKPENLEDIKQHSPLTRLFLQDASHNQDSTIGKRISNFKEFVDESSRRPQGT